MSTNGLFLTVLMESSGYCLFICSCAAAWSQCQVSPKAFICAAACVSYIFSEENIIAESDAFDYLTDSRYKTFSPFQKEYASNVYQQRRRDHE